MKGIDHTNKQFGLLTAVELMPSTIKRYKPTGRPVKQRIWKCLCECGNITFVNASFLTQGHTKSCGCLVKRMKNPELLFKRKYGSYKSGAKNRNLEFKLLETEVRELFFSNCHYCGSVPMTTYELKVVHNTHPITYNGIDRIDSSKGYVKNNVVSCCKICNRAKSDMSYKEFLSWMHKVKINEK
ncbi:hypothetical protein BH09PAT1_BH09PAT1_7440 [soil metagenome]